MVRRIIKHIRNYRQFLIWKRQGFHSIVKMEYSVLPTNEELKGKVCVVTGGAKGLGLEITKCFLKSGAKVIMIGSNIERLENAKKEIDSDNVYIYQWDLTKLDMIEEHIRKLIHSTEVGRIDIWVNNAGFLITDKSIAADPMGTFDKTFDLNVKSLYFVGMCVCNYWKLNQIHGKMINISSENSVQGRLHPYFISKSAVNSITEGLARQYVLDGINVNGIAPGYLPSGINYTDVYADAFRNESKNKRYVLLEEVAELAQFLVSGRANAIVGQTIFIDGGDTLR